MFYIASNYKKKKKCEHNMGSIESDYICYVMKQENLTEKSWNCDFIDHTSIFIFQNQERIDDQMFF